MTTPRPSCENHDPEIWFPETRKQHNKRDMEEVAKAIEKGVLALKICATCPLMANGWCVEDAFSNVDSVRYGISAGLLPSEKRDKIDYYMSDLSRPFWDTIRRKATEQGVPVPDMTKREKPKKSYDINAVIIAQRRVEPYEG